MSDSSSMETIFSWTLSLNKAISISLMKDNNSRYNKFFIFLSVIPDTKKEDGSRAYNYSESITFKLTPIKLLEINQVINAYARRQQAMIGNYGIMTDSSRSNYGDGNGNKKSFFINYHQDDPEKKMSLGMSFVAKSGNQTITLFMPIATALAFAEVCKKLFDSIFEREQDEFVPFDKNKNNRNNSQSYNYQDNSNNTAPSENSSFVNFNDEVPF